MHCTFFSASIVFLLGDITASVVKLCVGEPAEEGLPSDGVRESSLMADILPTLAAFWSLLEMELGESVISTVGICAFPLGTTPFLNTLTLLLLSCLES